MEYLTRDPIIEAYFNFRHANEDDVPVFSETVLRLALKHVLQFKNQREDELLSMYRKLITIILHMNHGKTLEELTEIMICYDSNAIMKILEDMDEIEDTWKIFTVEDIMYFIRKQAFFIILYEWTRRYVRLYGKAALNDEKIGDMTLRLHDHFNWPVKSVHLWKRSFESKFLKGNSKEFDDHDLHNIRVTDLTISKITADLGEKIHPLIHENNLRNFSRSIQSINFEVDSKANILKPPRRAETSIKILNVEAAYQQLQRREVDKRNEDSAVVEYVHVVDMTDDEEVVINYDDDEDDNDIVDEPLTKKLKTSYTDDDDEDEDSACSEKYDQKNETKTVDNKITETQIKNQQANSIEVNSYEQAIQSVSALQAYAVVNGLFDAIVLLDQVDSIFRTKNEERK